MRGLPLYTTITLSLFTLSKSSIVYTNDGAIEGKLHQYNDIEYLSYRGIPYAEPPIGDLRFMPPLPKKSWTGTLDGTKQKAVCPQAESSYYKTDQMNEDCLFLNIYVPLLQTDEELLPVMFFVIGGEFNALSGYDDVMFGPQLILEQNIIVVTFNHSDIPCPISGIQIAHSADDTVMYMRVRELKIIYPLLQRAIDEQGQWFLLWRIERSLRKVHLLIIRKPRNILTQIRLMPSQPRLGALGFMSLNIPEASGNAGLKDAILALKWVNKNIQCFGGDAEKITLGGNSAGAALTHYLMLSESTSGLFQRAFLNSGSALGYRFLARHPVENAIALAKEIGIESNNKTQVLLHLKEADAFTIVEAQSTLGKGNKRNGFRTFAPFVPSIEIESTNAVLTDEPINIIKSGIPQNVPTLTGFNAKEGMKMLPAILRNVSLIEELNGDFKLCVPSDLEYPSDSEELNNLAQSIKEFYFNAENISKSNIGEFVNMITDTQFYHSTDYWIKLHKAHKESNTLYYYKFDYDGSLNWFKLTNQIDLTGPAHADELGYMFVTRMTAPLLQNATDTDNRVMQNFLSLWTNFIKYGYVCKYYIFNKRLKNSTRH
ncbi:Esterase E4 [Eumeta japonica]|uniref:Carboxylic ester hydrolase n=1 Tax=Eumeta variegata TaxID=151549 RepID=A0A4C1XAF0_EUMVA|nr:Esterase E4 [Eumeta japonica]